MVTICKNCNTTFTGKFCNNCGQTAETHPITVAYLWHDIQHSLLHFDKGIIYSFRELFSRPGHSVREFIEGKRVKHFKPLSLVVVTASLYAFLYHYFDINIFQSADQNPEVDISDFKKWTTDHFSWFTIITIPIYTIGTYVCFRKQGHNFIEYFVLNTFKASQRLLVQILAFPFLYYYNGTPKINTVLNFVYVLGLVLIFWTNLQFFNKISKLKVFLLSILSHLIFLTLFFIFIFLVLLASGVKII
ncbi:DUF3667 domain-containing protein [Flavobacterium ustbae]|uniref:DUF3667 domain-containing protein n=1 Tax=Flavobacterium ustbae TaxID=2488790 RepID=UPI000F7663BC|nr:DUF3667 domain-containing protein [Flavobacterium ustbae]